MCLVDSQPIAKLVRKDTASTMLKKLFSRSPRKSPELKKSKMQTSLEETLAKTNSGPDSARAKLALLVIPEVFRDYDETRQAADPKIAKEWAEACAEVMGLLIGTCVKRDRIASAIADLMDKVKNQALIISRSVNAMTGPRSGSLEPLNEMPAPVTTSVKSTPEAPTKDHRLRVIEDLESQAALTQAPEAKQALIEMAIRMRREVELDNAA